jgi:hypothetical protein
MEQDEKEKLRIRECREEYEAKRRVWEREAAERQAQRELAERIIKAGRKGLAKELNRFGRDKRSMRLVDRACKRLRNSIRGVI